MIIKVCGMREADNIRAVSEQVRPDWMGFICWAGSKRHVASVPGWLPPPPIRRVGVFVNPTLEEVQEHVRQLGLLLVQLHGSETPDFCRTVKAATGLPLVKAFPIGCAADLEAVNGYQADYFLFDTRSNAVGGSGQQFDWQLLNRYRGDVPFLLSGGLGPADIARVRAFRHPLCCGFDLNSRFETAPAVKDATALATFVQALKHEI